jgi:hypothetical protein
VIGGAPRWLWLWLACLLCARASAQAPIAQDAAEPAVADGYQAAVERAVAEFSEGRWAEARALFGQAHALSPNARTLRGLGMSAFELRMYAQAIGELEAALQDTRKPLTDALRAHVLELLARARAFVGRVRIEASPAGAQVLVDGKPPSAQDDGAVLLDAGIHTVTATAEGYRAQSVRVQVEGGRADTVQLALQPLATPAPAPAPQPPVAQPPSAPIRAPVAEAQSSPAPREPPGSLQPYAWVSAAGAVAFGVAAAAFWAVGEGQYADLEEQCAPSCSDAQIDDSGVSTSDTLTNAFLGLSILSGLTSAVLFGIDASRDDAAPARVELAPGGVRVRGRF